MSCSTNASRSAGVSVSSTTSSASPTESASTASASGSSGPDAPAVAGARDAALSSTDPGQESPTGSSFRCRRDRSMFSDTLATTVVSQPPRFCTSLVSAPVSRSHVSWTASSASETEPSSR